MRSNTQYEDKLKNFLYQYKDQEREKEELVVYVFYKERKGSDKTTAFILNLEGLIDLYNKPIKKGCIITLDNYFPYQSFNSRKYNFEELEQELEKKKRQMLKMVKES